MNKGSTKIKKEMQSDMSKGSTKIKKEMQSDMNKGASKLKKEIIDNVNNNVKKNMEKDIEKRMTGKLQSDIKKRVLKGEKAVYKVVKKQLQGDIDKSVVSKTNDLNVKMNKGDMSLQEQLKAMERKQDAAEREILERSNKLDEKFEQRRKEDINRQLVAFIIYVYNKPTLK